jgi:membrane fusion protein, heavy metal efflux system
MKKIVSQPGLVSAVLIFSSFLAGCERPHGAHSHNGLHGHEHHSGERMIQVTLWSELHEVFLEYEPPIAGEPLILAVHVTEIGTGRARHQGPLMVALQRAAEPVLEQRVEQPARPGLYLPEIVFSDAGLWRAAIRIPGELEDLLPLPGIRVYRDPHDAAHGPAAEAPEGIDFLKEQQWRIGLRTLPAARRTLVERLPLPAIVSPAPGGKAIVHAPLAGRLSPAGEGRFPGIGDEVEAGDLLALIEPGISEFTARLVESRSELIRAQAVLEQAEFALERTRRLVENQARSQRELQEAEFSLRSARANHDAARAVDQTFRRTGLEIQEDSPALAIAIQSPISGRIEKIDAAIGEQVSLEKALFTIVNTATVHLEAQIAEAGLERLRTSLPAHITFASNRKEQGEPWENLEGKLIMAGQELDPLTRTVRVVYELANPEGRLRLGSMITVHAATQLSRDTVAIPAGAIVEEEGAPVAFVQLAGETFEMRMLELGIAESGWVEVKSGIEEGERVVVDGAYAVLLSTKSSGISDHHHH